MTIRAEQIVLATEVYLGGWARSFQSAKSSTDANALFYFANDADIDPLVAHQTRDNRRKNMPGKRFQLILVEIEDEESQTPEAPREYGQYAKTLKQSGFFRRPAVWRALGTDEQFREWVTYQPSVVSGQFSEFDEDGCGRCVACHVRRAGEAGVAHKPEYACVPMTNDEHQLQHQHGESAAYLEHLRIKGDFISDVATPEALRESKAGQAKEWFDRQRIETVERWAWECAKRQLGYESMASVPPEALFEWAEVHDLAEYLPAAYREVVA